MGTKKSVKDIRIYSDIIDICFHNKSDASDLAKEEGWKFDGFEKSCVISTERKENYHINITGKIDNVEFGGTEARNGVFISKGFECSFKKLNSPYHNAIYCTKNPTKVNSLWRYGTPVIRECMDENYPERGTGHYGCGLYTFRDKPLHRSDDDIEIDVSGFRFYYPETSKELETLIEFDKRMNEIARRYGMYKSDLQTLSEEEYLPKWSIEGININEKDILNAIGKTRTCLENETIEDNFYCSPPINHLLLAKGYDGIVPLSSDGDSLRSGALIFKESVENKLGRELRPREEFEF